MCTACSDTLNEGERIESEASVASEFLPFANYKQGSDHWTNAQYFKEPTVVPGSTSQRAITIYWDKPLSQRVPDDMWICCRGHPNPIVETPHICPKCEHVKSEAHCKEPGSQTLLKGADRIPPDTWVCCSCYWSLRIPGSPEQCGKCGHRPGNPHCYGPGSIMISGEGRAALQDFAQEGRGVLGDTTTPWFKVSMAGPSEEEAVPCVIVGCAEERVETVRSVLEPRRESLQLKLSDDDLKTQLELVFLPDPTVGHSRTSLMIQTPRDGL